MKTILVCGSRKWRDAGVIRLALMMEPRVRGWHDETIRVIHGAYKGADALADREAKDLGYEVKPFPADWESYGRAAGPRRNLEMIEEKPDLLLAFGAGIGTNGIVRIADERGIPVRRF